MPDQKHNDQHDNADSGIVRFAMLEAAKVAESKAWHRLQLEQIRIVDEIASLRGELDKIRDDWAEKYVEVNRINKLLSSNTN